MNININRNTIIFIGLVLLIAFGSSLAMVSDSYGGFLDSSISTDGVLYGTAYSYYIGYDNYECVTYFQDVEIWLRDYFKWSNYKWVLYKNRHEI